MSILDRLDLTEEEREQIREADRAWWAEPWEEHWRGMPEFAQEDLSPHRTIKVLIRTEEDVEAFSQLVGQPVRELDRYTPSIWWPEVERTRYADKAWVLDPELPAERGRPRYPVYVPTKGRWETCYTIRALTKIGVPYRAVVEAQEAENYVRAGVPEENILVLPHRDKGLVVTRNWIWDHAQASGTPWFWTIDDNVTGFFRLHRNLKTPLRTGAGFRVMEEFAERFKNVAIAGMHYFMFASRKEVLPAFYPNRRVYSNMLIRTDIPFRNEGFFNDDTDLCLRVLKAGWATVLFNAFLMLKSTTMTVKGGMTPHYQGDGRLKMALELQRRHPDVTKVVRKWGRWQHHVDYSPFEGNDPGLREDAVVPEGEDEYGMKLRIVGREDR